MGGSDPCFLRLIPCPPTTQQTSSVIPVDVAKRFPHLDLPIQCELSDRSFLALQPLGDEPIHVLSGKDRPPPAPPKPPSRPGRWRVSGRLCRWPSRAPSGRGRSSRLACVGTSGALRPRAVPIAGVGLPSAERFVGELRSEGISRRWVNKGEDEGRGLIARPSSSPRARVEEPPAYPTVVQKLMGYNIG